MTRTLTPSDARQVLSDLLEALGEDADAVLTEVLADRDVRSLRVVGPLVGDVHRIRRGLLANVGWVAPNEDGAPDEHRFLWKTTGHAYGEVDRNPRMLAGGSAPTRLAADRALCLALRELGWSPVEVPTEQEAAVPQSTEVSVGIPVRVEEQADGSMVATRRNEPLQVDWAQGEPVERPLFSEVLTPRPLEGPPPVDSEAALERFNQRLSYGARVRRVEDGVVVEWVEQGTEVQCTVPRRILQAVGQEAIASRFALWVEMVRGQRTMEALGPEPAWVEACDVTIRTAPDERNVWWERMRQGWGPGWQP